MKKIGFTQGAFDTLHYGHINLLKKAKEHVDYLIVGVNSDELVRKYKNTETIIKQQDRMKIVESIRYVDQVVLCDTLDKMIQYDKFKFNIVFIGDDWKGTERWNLTEKALKNVGVTVEYIPYTKTISTTLVKEQLRKKDNNLI